MKINRGDDVSDSEPLGPRPAVPRAGVSPAAAHVLDSLVRQQSPVTIGVLAEATGLHDNTVREHLDTLVKAGFAGRERAVPRGRGRPAWLYHALHEPITSQSPEYAGLASALARHIARTSDTPSEDAVAAGAAWGSELAGDIPPSRSERKARHNVVQLLDQLGFAPETDSRDVVVRLTRCPLLEAAHQHPEVVCGVHLGIVRAALEKYGGDADRSDLIAFAEPGACRLDLLTPQERA